MRSVGEGAATGVFARGFASGVTGARMVGVEGVLWRRALTVGRDVDEEGWGRRDISREDSTTGHGGWRWRINQRNRMLDLVKLALNRPSVLAPIMEGGWDPGEPSRACWGSTFPRGRKSAYAHPEFWLPRDTVSLPLGLQDKSQGPAAPSRQCECPTLSPLFIRMVLRSFGRGRRTGWGWIGGRTIG